MGANCARRLADAAARNYIVLFVNGRKHVVTNHDAFLSLAEFLRCRLGLIGTKLCCMEGDCGACSVLVGRPADNGLKYLTVDACIQFMFQLDRRHVVTVEGLGPASELHPVQESMVRCHGSQCGFCTPGFVVAMAGMLECNQRLGASDLRYGLTGNLCRCTGYSAIIESGVRLGEQRPRKLNERFPPEEMLGEFTQLGDSPIDVTVHEDHRVRVFHSPLELSGAIDFLVQHPRAKIVAGATDVGVQVNRATIDPAEILDLNRIAELEGVTLEGGQLVAGARATWTEIEHATKTLIPQFHELLALFGSPQIRNTGTIGGNIVNASPAADSLPFLYVVGAELDVVGPSGLRRVNVNNFYQGYKQCDLRPGEIVTRVRIPLPRRDQILRLYKVSRRRDLDMASLVAAISVELDSHTIVSASVALGAVGPTVIRARNTEAFLTGKQFSEQTMRQAGETAVAEVSPISDVRGSQMFRQQLTHNVFLKFFHETQADGARPAAMNSSTS